MSDCFAVSVDFGGACSKGLTPISEEEEETRAAEDAPADATNVATAAAAASVGASAAALLPRSASSLSVKENRWKLAFRQLVFMKRMNMQFNDRAKNEIELRQQNISPLSLMCSIPYFNALAPDEITALVAASAREQMRPGESKALAGAAATRQEQFFIVISGNLALARATAEDAAAVKQAALLPTARLGIGDFFASHAASKMKVIALEPVECLVLPMRALAELRPALCEQIQAESSDASSEASEFAVASTKCEYPTATPGGLAQCSAKAFCKDHFPHMSPENELDHALEHTRAALTTVFGARRVRVYAVDASNARVLVKFSDERLPKASVSIDNTVAGRVLEARAPVFVARGADVCRDASDALAAMLYQLDDMVLAAPFFEYVPLSVHRPSQEPARVVGVLEVVIGASGDDDDRESVAATENDRSILEITAQELGRYLYFHYSEFFDAPPPSPAADAPASVGSEDDAHAVESLDERDLVSAVLPVPDVGGAADDARTLVVSVHSLELVGADAVASAEVHLELGRVSLASRALPLSPAAASPTKERRTPPTSPRKRVFARAPSVEMGLSLANLPHGSRVRVVLRTKRNAAVAWTGVHLFDFGHALRTGRLVLDVRAMTTGGAGPRRGRGRDVVTSLDIENCLKRDRADKRGVVGSLELALECSGASPLRFAFSSLAKKKSITFRASIFYSASSGGDSGDARAPEPAILAEALAALPDKKQRLLGRVQKDPLVLLSADDRRFVWEARAALVEEPALLPTFLLAVDWGRREQVMDAYRLLRLWTPPTYLQALQLLSPAFPDPKVRAYAVRCMHALPDHRLALVLPQLVQALKNERYHDSALARFLLLRGLGNPPQIGYLLYWFLRAEAHEPATSERFALLVAQYLQLCGSFKLELRQSEFVMKTLEAIAAAVKREPTAPARRDALHRELQHAVLPETFQIPLHPRTYYSGVVVAPSRVMESKKRPLLLQLASAKAQHGRPFVIFKSGDDLRQDQLVLQLLRVMDDLWREAGLDLCLSPYACIATGAATGMIEVVADAETLASIITGRHDKASGGRATLGRKLRSAKDALVTDGVISDWLFKQQPPPPPPPTSGATASASPPGSPPSGLQADSVELDLPPRSPTAAPPARDAETTQNFLRSCAGYCVATFVLGIGDRHNDNLMLARSGKFFHVDFGHFLGNFKSKLGVRRERAPFVFTPAMLDAIGGAQSANYAAFQALACDAFRVLRAHSNLLLTLLVLALPSGIPELATADDIRYVHKALMIEFGDAEAEARFRRLITVALHTKTTQLNDAVHLMAH
ncbi:hypothetical protein PybrP1_007480 [[Pythium] brassicae (nom. inval.)]|nr:hypothetical protein PybrP1_007480 [[Pythium] brassicae (nom. inval.)]